MAYESLLRIDKPFFSQYDVAHAIGIELNSAAVLCSRYAKKGLLTRLKRGLYSKTESLAYLGQIDLFRISNILQVPSYISLMTALSFYGITTKVNRGFFESISVKRTKRFEIGGFSFHYTKIKPEIYRDFTKRDGIFIALPEKAIMDSFYLASMGCYAIDISSIDLTKLNMELLTEISLLYNSKARQYFERHIWKD